MHRFGVGGRLRSCGFEAAGFETAIAVEMDAVCCRTLRLNRPWPVIEGDIHDVTSKALLKTAKLKAVNSIADLTELGGIVL